MKTFVKRLLLLILLVPAFLSAQDKEFDKIFNKYNGKEGVTIVNFSGALLQMMMQQNQDSVQNANLSQKQKDIKEVMANLSMIKVITMNIDNYYTEEFRKDISKSFKSGFVDLITVKEGTDDVRIAIKQNDNKKITDMLVIVLEKDETVLVNISGLIDFETLSRLQKDMDLNAIKGMTPLK